MTENTSAAWREQDAPYTQTDQFLWWLSTAEPELIHDCKVDRNRYRITGLIVLGTWLFATMAWTYFFSTAVDSAAVFIPMGLFMGFIILTIDRALIKGINRTNKNKMGPLLFRGLLALTIGLFMAQPAVLYLFDKEVKMQASIDNEGRKQKKRLQLEALYAGQKTALEKEKADLQKTLDTKYREVENARANFLAETDGSGGSGKVGISTIAMAKRSEYQKLDAEYKKMELDLGPKKEAATGKITAIEDSIQSQEKQFSALLNNGFLTRIEALQNLVKSNEAVAFRYYLIIIILMLIELMPVIAKSMLPNGPYEEKIRMTEAEEKERTRRNLDREESLKEHFNQAGLDADKAAIDAFFERTHERRIEKMEQMAEQWSGNKHQSFDGLWRRIKREVLSRQEG